MTKWVNAIQYNDGAPFEDGTKFAGIINVDRAVSIQKVPRGSFERYALVNMTNGEVWTLNKTTYLWLVKRLAAENSGVTDNP